MAKPIKNQALSKLVPDSILSDSGDSNDPRKIWVLMYYPDSLEITAELLYKLLNNLRCHDIEDEENPPLKMYQCEWTLSARVNSKSKGKEDAPQPVQQDVTTDDTDQPLKDPPPSAEGNDLCCVKPMPTDYFCITAPVGHPSNDITTDSCHYVRCFTETVVVDLRYKGFKTGSDDLLDKIADKVRDIVMSTLRIKEDPKNSNYRVYVLKPQHQTRRGVSPTHCPSCASAEEEVDQESVEVPDPKRSRTALKEQST